MENFLNDPFNRGLQLHIDYLRRSSIHRWRSVPLCTPQKAARCHYLSKKNLIFNIFVEKSGIF